MIILTGNENLFKYCTPIINFVQLCRAWTGNWYHSTFTSPRIGRPFLRVCQPEGNIAQQWAAGRWGISLHWCSHATKCTGPHQHSCLYTQCPCVAWRGPLLLRLLPHLDITPAATLSQYRCTLPTVCGRWEQGIEKSTSENDTIIKWCSTIVVRYWSSASARSCYQLLQLNDNLPIPVLLICCMLWYEMPLFC